jgi:hypothetical protein
MIQIHGHCFLIGLPELTCDEAVTAKEHQKGVNIMCQVVAYPPLTNVYIHWAGGSLRPVDWQNGIKFARHGHIMAYARPQVANL